MLINPIASILHRGLKKDKFNIIVFHTDVFFEYALCQTGHNFYAWTDNYAKRWPKEVVAKPKNYTELKTQKDMSNSLIFDFILCQMRGPQYDMANEIGKALHIPKIVFNTLLPASFNTNVSSRTGDIDVYQGEKMREGWQAIGAEIDYVPFKLDFQVPVNTVAPYVDYLCPETEQLQKAFKVSQHGNVYLNIYGPAIQQGTLNAMGRGHIPIVFNSNENKLLIDHGKNGFLCSDLNQIMEVLNMLQEQPDIRDSICNAAFETVKDLKMEDFLSKWNEVFESTKSIVYMR